MKTIKQMLITVVVLLCSATANAHDFEVDGIYYNIISANDLTVAVTYKGNSDDEISYEYSGEVIIPETIAYKSKVLKVTSIGVGAFAYCHGLTSVTIPNSVTSIGGKAFYRCSYLKSVTIPNSVTSIGEQAFSHCYGFTSIEIPNSVTSIGGSAFSNCERLASVVIGNSVTSIGDWAFYNCRSLKDLRIEDGETTLSLGYNDYNEGLFYDCPLETLYIGRNLDYNASAYYGYSPFCKNKTLKSVTIGNSVTSIGNYAFYNCSGLTSIEIPNSVTSIGESAFSGCSGITNISLKCTTPPTVGSNNFTNAHYINVTVYVPQGAIEAYQAADVWKEFWDIQEFDATGIEGVNANDIAIEVTANGITLSDADGKTVAIYSANGTRVANIGSYVGEEITLDKGVYIVRVGDKTMKVKL